MRLHKSTSWYFIFLCLLSNLCSAQSPRFSIEYFSKEDGLIDHRILIGRLHSDGLMWLGTAKGLLFYD